MSEIPNMTRDESFHIISEDQLNQLFLPRSAWKSDEDITRCHNCNSLFFLFFRRKHHCRKCGNIFCSKCSDCFFDASLLKLDNFQERIRLCNSCYSKFDDFKKFLTKEVNQNLMKRINLQTFESVVEDSKYHDEVDFINSSKSSVFHKNLDSKLDFLISAHFKKSGIFDNYYKILVDFIKVALNEVRPNSVFWGDQMDINNYIKIKKIPYFDNSESKYIRGVVFKKSLLDRKMPWKMENARILLFSSSIDCDFLQPNSKFGSFDSFITHEKGYFRNVAKNMIKMQPNVILIEKTINRYIAEALKNQNIMIFVKVKRSLLMKIARVSRCKIISDFSKLEVLNPEDYIGKCSSVYVKRLALLEQKQNECDSDTAKDFLYIEGCNSLFGVTLTISGPDMEDLNKLKSALKSIFRIGRSWLLENSLITLDQTFGEEIKASYFNQGNLAKQLAQENFSYEKIQQNESIFYTKVNFIKGDIKKIPDFEKNPYLIKDLEISLDQEDEESVLKTSKLDYFADICGYPSLKQIEFYSKEDISLGCYIIFKANSLHSRCVSCDKPRYFHVSIYYQGNAYIKITCDFVGFNKISPEKQYQRIDSQIRRTYSKGRKISDLSHSSPRTSFHYNNSPPKSSQNIEISSHSEKIEIYNKPRFSLFCISHLRITENLNTNMNMDDVRHRTKTMGWGRDSPSPAGTPKSHQSTKRNAVIKSYLECAFCEQKLTEMRVLDHDYLEYSLAFFLKKLFQSKFNEEDSKELYEHHEEELNCLHAMKVRVFEYEETLVKFYVSSDKFYRILIKEEFAEYKDKNHTWEEIVIIKKKEEYIEIFERSLERFAVLVECFINDEDVNKAGLKEHLDCLLEEIREFKKRFKLLFCRNFDLQEEVEEIRIAISREIIAFFDVFLMVIRVNKKSHFLESYSKHLNSKKMDLLSSQENKSPKDLVKAFLLSRSKDFFPEDILEYAKAPICKFIIDKEEDEQKKTWHLLEANMKYSCEPREYLFELEYDLVLQKKASDLVTKLFFEPQDNFRQKFKNDEAFQLKHLEIEFKEFLKLTGGQSIDNVQRIDDQNIQLFKEVPIDKHHPLGIVAHALNCSDYLEQIHSIAGKFKSIQELLQIKNEKSPKNFNPPQKFHLQTCLIESFLSTLTLINENKKTELENGFISQPNVSFPKYNKSLQIINIFIYLPIEFELFRASNSIPLKAFISSLAESAQIKAERPNSIILKPNLTSHDEYFLFKSVKKRQFQAFLKIADNYFAYLLEKRNEKKPSSLIKIFGLFQINLQNKNFYYICMENLLAGLENKPGFWRLYDLKGSSLNRYIVKDRLNRTLLDNNYKIERNGEPLPLKIEEKRDLDLGIDSDIEFLKSHQMIDYSLLLIENKQKGAIRTGIINFYSIFEENVSKKTEENINVKKEGEENKYNDWEVVGDNNPMNYAKKFKKAMRKYFMEIVDE